MYLLPVSCLLCVAKDMSYYINLLCFVGDDGRFKECEAVCNAELKGRQTDHLWQTFMNMSNAKIVENHAVISPLISNIPELLMHCLLN